VGGGGVVKDNLNNNQLIGKYIDSCKAHLLEADDHGEVRKKRDYFIGGRGEGRREGGRAKGGGGVDRTKKSHCHHWETTISPPGPSSPRGAATEREIGCEKKHVFCRPGGGGGPRCRLRSVLETTEW